MTLKTGLLATAAALTLMSGAASAQTPAPAATAPATATATDVKAGATVTDDKGGAVGTITAVSNGVATVDTGANKAGIPIASFAKGATGLMISMTKAQLDAAAQGAQASAAADLKAELTAGTSVKDAQGAPVGTIKTVDSQYASVDTGKAEAKLPLSAFAKSDNGVVVSMTKAQIEAAVSGAATTSAEPDASADAPK